MEEAEALDAALYRQLEATPERGADFAAAIRTVSILSPLPAAARCIADG